MRRAVIRITAGALAFCLVIGAGIDIPSGV